MSKRESILCDVCQLPLVKAAPNQKRHSGKCSRVAMNRAWTASKLKKLAALLIALPLLGQTPTTTAVFNDFGPTTKGMTIGAMHCTVWGVIPYAPWKHEAVCYLGTVPQGLQVSTGAMPLQGAAVWCAGDPSIVLNPPLVTILEWSKAACTNSNGIGGIITWLVATIYGVVHWELTGRSLTDVSEVTQRGTF